MDDDYELISKRHILELKEENKKLKEELAKKTEQKDVDYSKIVSQIVEVISDESKKEKEIINKSLNEIKELNKSTLDNLVTKTQELDDRLEGMITTMSELVSNLSEIIEHSSGNESENKILKDVSEIKNTIQKLTSNSQSNLGGDNVLDKLNEIELFMKNLKLLLSYVKPNDLIIDKDV